ncbi:hypothetical protein P0D88_23920 [Paraburkholderia sp. RL18-103-BIB-C]|uniref:hypothetical protein n=1 Tax=unclassified Paraburkholderia TaxID=2615204 RepID=UPI0038B8D95D
MTVRQAVMRTLRYVGCFPTCDVGFLGTLSDPRRHGLRDRMPCPRVVQNLGLFRCLVRHGPHAA